MHSKLEFVPQRLRGFAVDMVLSEGWAKRELV